MAGALALSGGPAAYSAASLGHGLNGNDVTAGPASANGGFGRGGMHGGGAIGDELIDYLRANQGSAKYLVAASGSQATAPIIVATGEPVVTIGGFGGRDPAPTVEQLAELLADGQLSYVLLSADGEGRGGPGGASTELTAWVQEHGTVVDGVESGGMTLYHVTA